MVKDILMKTLQPHRLAVGDEVHLVALTCQRHAQFCGDHTTTSIRGITNDTYFHAKFFLRS